MPLSTINQAGLASPLTLTLPVVATTMGVGGATASASGSGITFPATQSASSDANTLDDYEEGTWTPTLGGTATYVNRVGRYTKIGNKVFFEVFVEVSLIGTGFVGDIMGLPFTTNASNPLGIAYAGYYAASATPITVLAATIFPNATTLNLRVQGNIGSSMNAVAFFQNGTSCYLNGQYTV